MNIDPRQELAYLRNDHGIVFPGAVGFIDSQLGMDTKAKLIAEDTAPTYALQSQGILTQNAGIPAYLTNFMDPELMRILTTPLKAVELFGETKKGDWTTMTATFPVIESAGEVSSYGDFNNNGSTNANMNFEPRQSYHFQTITKWGDKELETAGLAKVDWAAEQNIASALVINKFQNKSYFYGVSGLDNYGFLNDPSLPASIAATGVWSGLTGAQIWTDIQRLFTHLQSQLKDNLEMTDKMTLGMSPLVQPYLLTPMSVSGVIAMTSVADYLKSAFPNLTVKTAVEYSTTGGELIQLFVDQVQGQKLGYCAFTEKMRAHAIVRDTSSVYQKKSGGTWGGILKLPIAVASLLGA